mmetsp:Transcript_78197/g.221086  ORF Transcript_78197/g.221086 Transcript_78197/m.221086 type:complete len:165 (-) Transcript_78197:128-622(-)
MFACGMCRCNWEERSSQIEPQKLDVVFSSAGGMPSWIDAVEEEAWRRSEGNTTRLLDEPQDEEVVLRSATVDGPEEGIPTADPSRWRLGRSDTSFQGMEDEIPRYVGMYIEGAPPRTSIARPFEAVLPRRPPPSAPRTRSGGRPSRGGVLRASSHFGLLVAFGG